jgi:hypothetical protein
MDVTKAGNGHPAKPAGLSTGGTRATRTSDRAPGGSAAPAGSTGRGDRVTISEEALRLLDATAPGTAAAEPIPASALSTERRAELLDRISGGWYDRPEVTAAVVHELAGVLAGDDSATEPR